MRQLFKLTSSDGRGETKAPAVFSWEPKGNFLATGGGSGVVHVWDRHGEHCYEISLTTTSPVSALEWDKDGDCLAILQEGQGLIPIWDMQYREVTRLDTALKDPSYMKWSRSGPQLVIGTAKGNVMVYNRHSRKKVNVLGKHPRRISCGAWLCAWSKDNRLALGSDDCTLTLSNEQGDTMEQTELKHAPREMVFATQKTNGNARDGAATPESHLSINMGGQSLLLYDLNDPDNPLELAFQQRYGSIVAHQWFGDGFMMLGFSEGFLVVISTHISEIGEELFSGRFHHKALYDIAYSPTLKYAAVAGDTGVKLVNEQEYLGKVDKICLNGAHAAVLSGTRVTLHEIEAQAGAGTQRKTFPVREDEHFVCATAIALTRDFLIYGTQAGTVEFFAVHPDEWTMLPGHQGFIYNPVSAELTSIPSFPPSVQCVMWDARDRNVLLVADGKELHTYVYAHTTIKGPMAAKLGPVDISADGEVTMIQKATPVQQGLYPICSREGTITCQVATGSITSITCPQYEHKEAGAPHQLVFCQNLALLRLKDAWNAALALKNRAYWLALSGKAMEIMDIDLAIRVYRQLGDAGMVMGLERIAHLEDKNLLAGHVLLLFSNYNAAQDLFLSSLKLAHTLDPSQVPYISVAYAQQLEFKGEYETALRMFEAALRACDDRGDVGESKDGFGDGPPPTAAPGGALPASSASTRPVCLAGVARCTLRMGDLRRGIQYVKESSDRVCRDCAAILEGMNQHSEAASLFELAEHFEKAAAIYIRKLNFTQAAAIMHKVALPKLHAQYAKACEAAGKLGDAVKAYEVAHDMDSVVRLYLGNLNQPERAFEIVRKTESSDGAQLVARFCQQQGDFRGAIEFLLMAKRSDEAFNLSKLHSQMDVYTAVLGDAIAPDDALSAAKTAVIIARQEQDLGSYKAAHAILYETTIQLEAQEVHVPQNLRKPFILLHSYLLVKKLIKAGDHDAAARMLLRVAKSISKFPSHGAPILTSTVIECQRAGLKASAHEYATQLMRPELRGKIDPKFKRKIEQMIRRPNLEEEPELLSPCPISGVMIPRTELECPTTKEEIPMCVVTGRHMEKDDWCVCPNSKMPALHSEYAKYIKAEMKAARDQAMKNEAKGAPEKGQLDVLDPVTSQPISLDKHTLLKKDEVEKFLENWAK
ncbi:hypothetical protein JL720_2712 [Aureococcus anophagefferens]|nr:hypothetical protein JL720_2712 [Aureococcus anophagefferens]